MTLLLTRTDETRSRSISCPLEGPRRDHQAPCRYPHRSERAQGAFLGCLDHLGRAAVVSAGPALASWPFGMEQANRLLEPLGLKVGLRSFRYACRPAPGEVPTPWRLYTVDGRLVDTLGSLEELMAMVAQRHPEVGDAWKYGRLPS